jgi:hypothetical protein
MENVNSGEIEFLRHCLIFLEKRNCHQKVLKGILKGKPAPDVPVFQEFSLKSPKAIFYPASISATIFEILSS